MESSTSYTISPQSPPYSPPDQQQQEDQTNATMPSEPTGKFLIALHSVRITRFGYTIDPLELRFPEVINGITGAHRRASLSSFDPSYIGHTLLNLIRGFWSQPGFPKGKITKPSVQMSINATIAEFMRNPFYPHKHTYGGMAKERSVSSRSSSRSKKSLKQPSSVLSNLVVKSAGSDSSQSSLKIGKNSYLTWIPKDKEPLAELITSLLVRMEGIFSNEERVIKVASPCLVLGDIHGNLTDLRTYERSLWPKAPMCLTNNYLFLGDYVDRGDYSIESVLYLFSLKLISPHRFFLLRGNHEVASIQKQYTFEKECEEKFGPIGKQLWKNFNRVFDLMPIAAVIDNQIFCAHGGIPRSISEIKTLVKEIPTPLDNPEFQCPAAWEILWNDPITDSELIGMIEMDNASVPSTSTLPNAASETLEEETNTQPRIQPVVQPVTPVELDTATPATSATTATSALAAVSETIQSSLKVANKSFSTPVATALPPNASNASSIATNTVKPMDQSMSESDKILVREREKAPTSALSFYIRPQNQNDPRDPQNLSSKRDDDNTLRTVPSDTSSIASTSPQQMINDGFVANIKRGTGYLFSDQAVNHFLKVNNLSHVIRAHEVIPTGFAFHGDGRVITIFSSSQYCGLNNQTACALVDRDRIRILRLDTGDVGE